MTNAGGTTARPGRGFNSRRALKARSSVVEQEKSFRHPFVVMALICAGICRSHAANADETTARYVLILAGSNPVALSKTTRQ